MKLETALVRTFKKIERMMEKEEDSTRINRFYSLIHHYEKLNDRYIQARGCAFNPVRYQEQRE